MTEDIRKVLFENCDSSYADFHSSLVPTLPRDRIIGVRMPVLRKIAMHAAKEDLPVGDYYYEELMVRGMKIGYRDADIEKRLSDLKAFIPLIDNWAVCDCCCATYKFTEKNRAAVWDFILPYINKSEYEARFAVVMMMDYFLTDEYIDSVISLLSAIESDDYYVNMAVAWVLSAAFVKYEERVYSLLSSDCLSPWVHNKTIQKLCESRRVNPQTKEYLKTLKRQG